MSPPLSNDHFAERERILRLSRAGLVFCGMHAVYFVAMIVGMYSVGDSASVIFVALAVLPAGLLLSLLESLGSDDFRFLLVFWINNPFLLYPVNLVIAYLFGWAQLDVCWFGSMEAGWIASMLASCTFSTRMRNDQPVGSAVRLAHVHAVRSQK